MPFAFEKGFNLNSGARVMVLKIALEEEGCAHAISLTKDRHTTTSAIALYNVLYLSLYLTNIMPIITSYGILVFK